MSELHRLAKRRAARKKLELIFDRSDVTMVVHYSCESFFKQNDGSSSRIASIAARRLSDGNTRSFSIHHYAEKRGIPTDQLEEKYEEVERDLLQDYFDFVGNHMGFNWAHWNMRNINFGFPALEHRFEVLGGSPKIVPDARKVDLAAVLSDLFGGRYEEKPVLVNLCERNEIRSDLFLPGADEAAAFAQREYMRLHQSTQKKVDFISYVSELALDGKLKTAAPFWQRYGVHPRVLIELVREHWLFGLAAALAVLASLGRLLF